MLVDELKKASVQALRDHNENARNILGVVLNKIKLAEINKRAEKQELTDADVVVVLQKTARELEEERQGYEKAGNAARAQTIAEQAGLVDGYLPKMMSDAEIKKIIEALPDRSVPAVMRHFKENYAGKCEMRLVQQVLKGMQ